jgi:hypothetical protein
MLPIKTLLWSTFSKCYHLIIITVYTNHITEFILKATEGFAQTAFGTSQTRKTLGETARDTKLTLINSIVRQKNL